MNYAAILDDLHRWNRLFGGGIPSEADIEAAMRGNVDEETRRLMESYTRTLDREIVAHESASTYRDTWSLEDFERFIADFIASVPADKRATATVELKGGHEESTELVVSYERPQTDDEWALDVAHALMHARQMQARDLAAYERVKRRQQTASASGESKPDMQRRT